MILLKYRNQYFRLMTELEWKEKTLSNGVKQFVHHDEDLEEELMMLPTDLALVQDKSFAPWVKKYAEDKDVFFKDFADAFAKLIELGIKRDENGKVVNKDNLEDGYHSAPKKSDKAGKPDDAGDGVAEPLKEENKQFKAKL